MFAEPETESEVRRGRAWAGVAAQRRAMAVTKVSVRKLLDGPFRPIRLARGKLDINRPNKDTEPLQGNPETVKTYILAFHVF